MRLGSSKRRITATPSGPQSPAAFDARPAAPARAVAVAIAIALAGAVAATAAGRPYPEAPPPAHTGGFDEPTCYECHFDGEVDDPAGTLAISGVPAVYTPGARYRIVVELTRPEMLAGGFQLAARFAAGERAGAQAGTARTVDDRVASTTDRSTGVVYLHHSLEGTRLTGENSARWVIEWTAPEDGGEVVFHAAANATNDDASPFGDWVYTASRRSRVTGA